MNGVDRQLIEMKCGGELRRCIIRPLSLNYPADITAGEGMKNWLMCVVVTLLVQAPTRAALEPPFASTHGAFFALSVADIDSSVKWYSEKLGLAVVMRSPKQDKASAGVLEGSGLTVELVKHDVLRQVVSGNTQSAINNQQSEIQRSISPVHDTNGMDPFRPSTNPTRQQINSDPVARAPVMSVHIIARHPRTS
jgi:predicted lactoylglutathione lyase